MPIRGTFQMLDVTSLSPSLTLMLSAVVSKHSENFWDSDESYEKYTKRVTVSQGSWTQNPWSAV